MRGANANAGVLLTTLWGYGSWPWVVAVAEPWPTVGRGRGSWPSPNVADRGSWPWVVAVAELWPTMGLVATLTNGFRA